MNSIYEKAFRRVEQALEERRHDPDDVLPQEDQRREHRTRLDDRRERRDVRRIDLIAEQLLHDGQVTRAGDREELGETLHRPEQHCFDNVHTRPPLSRTPDRRKA